MDNIQKIRLVDIFILAPFMVYAGAVKSNLPVPVRVGLVVSGVATFVYSGNNYIENVKKNKSICNTLLY
jgi:hypothetical protein